MKKILVILFVLLCGVSEGTTWLDIQNKPVVDVRDYGAVGDGATDDSEHIYNAVVSNNTIASSEYVGLQYNADGQNNRIFGNKISDCADAGIYFDSKGTSPVYFTDNELFGNNNNVASYGGRLMQCNISLMSDYGVFKNNQKKMQTWRLETLT
ncbi:MAG: right-handed parallel beta-helix repeat-containing protein [Candidatus Riflebacteria bacterium]|nr:right-handed parallel beta-helix repeat-containing protein [Candidatus Riflebacteria bacterium]